MSNINNLVLNTNRNSISIGQKVAVIEKQNQKNNNLTIGHVKKILTNSLDHSRGIKVMLDNGKVGRVQKIF